MEEKMKQITAVGRRPLLTFGQVCNYMITNILICAIDGLQADRARPLLMELPLTPSQAALLRVMLWYSVAASAARRWVRLALAQAALACTVATQGVKMYLIFFHDAAVTPQLESSRLLSFLLAVGTIVVIAAAGIFFFVVLLLGGVEEEE